MLVIDHDVEKTLTKDLKKYRDNPGTSRAIVLINHQDEFLKIQAATLKTHIMNSVERYLPTEYPQVYFCKDGDIFILAPIMPTKEARLLMIDLATHFNMAVDNEWITLYTLSNHADKLISIVEKKTTSKSHIIEEQIYQRKTAMNLREEQGRYMVEDVEHAQERIAQIRSERKTPEIMVVDGDEVSRRLVENVLGNTYHVNVHQDATHILETYTSTAPDLLLLDIDLPNAKAHELLEEIIRLDPHAYVVMLSGNRNRDNLMQAMNKGAMGFIGKPLTHKKLLQYAERACSRKLR